jgi:cbb3-type cytochrome c oxidase subunit II
VEEGTILGDRDRVYPEGSTLAAGRAIYLEEGCYYCHTQQVRPIVTDVGLGVVSEAGDYVHETPAALGVERLGPDLTHVGDRYPTAGVLISRLVDPRGSRSWSIMPSYDRLSDEELDALAEYLLSLR